MAQKSRRETGSTPLVGSSRNRTCGLCSSVHIRFNFCFMPPESLAAGRLRNGSMRVIRSRRAVSSLRSSPEQAEQVGVEIHVLFDGKIAVQAEALRHVADAILHRVGFARHVVAGYPGFAVGGVEQTAEQPDGGGLSRAVGTHQPEDLSARHLEAEAVDGGEVPELARQISDLDDGVVHD